MREIMGKYILDGKALVRCDDVLKWGAWFEKADRIVAKTQVGEVLVSTVFLGIDHNFSDAGPPVLFETMVFGGELDDTQDRYRTWEEAERGHELLVAKVVREEPRADQVV